MKIDNTAIEALLYKLITIEHAIAGANHEDSIELFAIQEQLSEARELTQGILDKA